MKKLLPTVALLLLVGTSAHAGGLMYGWYPPSVFRGPWGIPLPPIFITPPPVVYAPPPPVIVGPPPPPPPPVCVVNLPPWEWLNLRTFPNGPIIGAMPPGTPLTLVGPLSGRWGLVQTPNGVTGWAFLPYAVCN
jgi:hypothetical protein